MDKYTEVSHTQHKRSRDDGEVRRVKEESKESPKRSEYVRMPLPLVSVAQMI